MKTYKQFLKENYPNQQQPNQQQLESPLDGDLKLLSSIIYQIENNGLRGQLQKIFNQLNKQRLDYFNSFN